jgi:YidC/Oxa1 family membrane protein insertase
MDKKTIIAIVISAVLFIGYFLISNFLFPAKPQEATQQTAAPPQKEAEKKFPAVQVAPIAAEVKAETLTFHSNIYDITFSNKGGIVTSILLNNADKDPQNKRKDDGVEMVYASSSGKPATEYPFELHFGSYESPMVTDLFMMKKLDDHTVAFSREFEVDLNVAGREKQEKRRIILTKTFMVVPDQYFLTLLVSFRTADNKEIPFDFEGVAYTLGIGPQIGPAFKGSVPDERSDYRRFVTMGKDRKEYNQPRGEAPKIITEEYISWAAITGKYYAMIASTKAPTRDLVFDSRINDTDYLRSAMYIERAKENNYKLDDMYAFFIGPKKGELLSSIKEVNFTIGNISYTKKDINFSELSPGSIFSFIAQILKYPLDFFALVGNYGVAIIFLTILIKLLLFPLTRKSFDSMKKMQAVNPKLQELRAKFKDNPKRLNAEMAELYKKEGISPLGGCLPQLLQLPILFGLYELFNTHFALKGAVFIPGWINDLSVPESIWTLPFPPINILGFVLSDLRLLPLIMLGTQFATTFFTQGQSTGGNNKMKYLPYVLMGVFFFILYNLPSGLVLYWTMQNILTVVQMLIQKYLSERKKKIQAVI